jgi:hypothetical protein
MSDDNSGSIINEAIIIFIIIVVGWVLYDKYYGKQQIEPMNNQPFNNQPFNNQPFNNQPFNNQLFNDQPFNNQPSNNIYNPKSRRVKPIRNIDTNKKIIRNPMKNPTTDKKYNKIPKTDKLQSYFPDGKYNIRDHDDSVGEILYAPISDVSCKYFNENDTYLKSMLHYNDTDQVDKINKFRESPSNKQYMNKPIMDIFDDLNGNNMVPQNDLLSKEGTSFSPGQKQFKTYNEDRWHYDKENSLNGGLFMGRYHGYDSSGSTSAALS